MGNVDAYYRYPDGIVEGSYATCLRGFHQYNILQDRWIKGNNLIVFDKNENWRKGDQPNIILDHPDASGQQILNVSIDAVAAHEIMHALGFQHFHRQEADYNLVKNAATSGANGVPPITANQFEFTWWRNYGTPESGGNTLTRFGPPFGFEEYYKDAVSVATNYFYTDPNDSSFVYDWTPPVQGTPYAYSFPMGRDGDQQYEFPWGNMYQYGRIPEQASIMIPWGQGLSLRDFYLINGMPSAAGTNITAETAMNWSQVDKRAVCGLYGTEDSNYVNMDGQCNIIPEVLGQEYIVNQGWNSALDSAAANGSLVIWDPGADATSPTCSSCWYVEPVEVNDMSEFTLGIEYQVNISGNAGSCEECEPSLSNITCVKLLRCDTIEAGQDMMSEWSLEEMNALGSAYVSACWNNDNQAISGTAPEVIWTSNSDILDLCTTANSSPTFSTTGELYVQLNEYPNVCYKVQCQECLESIPEPESTGMQAPAIFFPNETPPRARHSWGISDTYTAIDWSELGPETVVLDADEGYGTSNFNINYWRMSKFFESSNTPDSDIIAFGFQFQPCVNNQVYNNAYINLQQGQIANQFNSTLFFAPLVPEEIWDAWRSGGAVDVGNYLWEDSTNNSQSRCAVVIGYTLFDLYATLDIVCNVCKLLFSL